LNQFIAQDLGEHERELFFPYLAGNTGCSWVAAAMAGVDDDDWPASRDGRTVDAITRRRRQVYGEAGLRSGVAAAASNGQEDGRGSDKGHHYARNRPLFPDPVAHPKP